MASGMVGGGGSLSEVYSSAKRTLLRARDGIERLERFESTALMDSSDLTSSVKRDITEVQSLCSNMDALWRSISVKSQRDLWRRFEQIRVSKSLRFTKVRLSVFQEIESNLERVSTLSVNLRSKSFAFRSSKFTFRTFTLDFFYYLSIYVETTKQCCRKTEQVGEEAEYLNQSLEKYMWRNQRKMLEAKERADLLNRGSGEGAHILQIFDEEAQAMNSVKNSKRLLEESFSSGVAILSKYAEQRDRLKRAQRKALDVLNTVGLSNSVLRLIERRNRVDTWIKYAGMIATIVILYLFIKWTR